MLATSASPNSVKGAAREYFLEGVERDGVAARYGVRNVGGLKVTPRHFD